MQYQTTDVQEVSMECCIMARHSCSTLNRFNCCPAHLCSLVTQHLKPDAPVQLTVAPDQPFLEMLLQLPVQRAGGLQQQRQVIPKGQLVTGDPEAWAKKQSTPVA
jgi:hypothetical protein